MTRKKGEKLERRRHSSWGFPSPLYISCKNSSVAWDSPLAVLDIQVRYLRWLFLGSYIARGEM